MDNLKLNSNEQIIVKGKYNGIFGNIPFVETESLKAINYSTDMCRSCQGIYIPNIMPFYEIELASESSHGCCVSVTYHR